jgi:CrcB protein
MLNCLYVGLGGFAGSVLRYLVGLLPFARDGLPWKTLGINVLGAFALGLLSALAVKNPGLSPRLLLLLRVGVCGGFTTFSTFAFETSALLQSGQTWTAAGYMAASLVLGVAAAFAGQLCANA